MYCLLICHLADEERVQELLRPFSFSVTGSQGVTGTASEALAGIDARLAQIHRDQEAAATAIAESGASRDALRVYRGPAGGRGCQGVQRGAAAH